MSRRTTLAVSWRPRATRLAASRLRAGVLGAALAVAAVGLYGLQSAQAKVDPQSVISTIAGSGEAGFSGDGGTADQAEVNKPRDTAVGPDGSLYIADTFNDRIRKISPDGTISTVAGNGTHDFGGDGGPATEANVSWPHDLTVDASGVLYFADSNNHRVRRVDLDGTITTVVGTGVSGSSGDGGPATEARIQNPKSVVVSGDSLYLSAIDDKVRKVDLTTGIITTIAGTGQPGFGGDGGPALEAQLDTPQRLAVDSQGNIYIADTGNSAIRRVDVGTGVMTTVAGTLGVAGAGGDGPALESALDSPRGLALEGDDIVYIGDSNNHRVRRLDLTDGTITTLGGGPSFGDAGDGGPVADAQFYQPRGLTVTAAGELIVADTFNSRIRLITTPKPNAAPTAALSAQCAGLECSFDASGSADSDGTLAAWAWEFGDGETATDDGSAGAVTHTFAAGGMYQATVTVTDDRGATATAAVSVLLLVANQSPVAAFSVACQGLECTFDASGSTDADGSIASINWDFGDGSVDSGRITRHLFTPTEGVGPDDEVIPAPTEYRVSLAVVDDAGATATTSVVVPVTP